MKNGLVDTVSVSNTSRELLDHDECNHESLMSIARFIGWYEFLPPIIGKEDEIDKKKCLNKEIIVKNKCQATAETCAECKEYAIESNGETFFPWSEDVHFIRCIISGSSIAVKRMVIAVAVSFFLAFFVVTFITFYAWKRRSNSKRKRGSDDTKLLNVLKSSSLNFKYSTIEKATCSFDESNKLGEGGFGTVYKANPVKGKELNWEKRYDIILGIAEGLAYLHENTKTRIIHRDIKAANILWDSRFRAKIADFGLAKSYEQDKNHISTGIAGTLGYMAPEYIAHGKQTSEDGYGLVSTFGSIFKQGLVEDFSNPNLMLNDQISNKTKKEIQSVVHIGLLCTQEVASLRPTMSMALQMLSKNIEPLPSPATPSLVTEPLTP
ncbi:cysteine-rich receptor-like protein kinase 2 [Tanacetum coccineum]